MKKFLLFSLAALAIGLLGSCNKGTTERVDNLEKAIGQYSQLSADLTTVIKTLMAEVGTKPAEEQNTVWGCITSLQGQCSTLDKAVSALKTDTDKKFSELVSTYKLEGLAASVQAIKDVVEGKGSTPSLVEQIAQLKEQTDKIADILSRIGALETMIQTVSIVPAYSDGSVNLLSGGILELNLVVSPAGAIENLEKEDVTILLTTVLTKAAAIDTVKSDSITDFVVDKAKGTVGIWANIAEQITALADDESLSVAVNVRNGISDYTTVWSRIFFYDKEIWYWATNQIEVGGPGLWGNAGNTGNGAGFTATDIDGQWWGARSHEEFAGQIEHAGEDFRPGEVDYDAYMIWGRDGIIRSYDAYGNLLREGTYSVKMYPERRGGWELGKLRTDPGTILFPFSINEHGYKPEEFDIMYKDDKVMTLVYTKGNGPGSWGEITWWHFEKR